MSATGPGQHAGAMAGGGGASRARQDDTTHPLLKAVGIERLDPLLTAARSTGVPLPHVLLIADAPSANMAPYIAQIIAQELGCTLHPLRCAEMGSIDALLSALEATKDGDILYLDDVDALPQLISDTLARALGSGAITYVMKDDPGAPVRATPLTRLTVIGAAPTRSLLGSALTPHFAQQIDVRTLSVQWRTRVATQRARQTADASLDAVTALLARRTRELLASRVTRGSLRADATSMEVRSARREQRAIISYKIDASRATGKEPLPNDTAEGRFVLDGQSGQPLDSLEDRYINDNLGALLQFARESVGTAERDGTAPRASRSYDPVRARAQQRIIATHTAVVRRQGLDGNVYKRTYPPQPEDIEINIVMLPLVSAEGVARVGDQSFSAQWLAAPETALAPLLVRTTLPDALSLCESCGYVDNADWSCLYCRHQACLHCAPPVFKHYCSRECYDRKQHETLLAKLEDDELRGRIESSGELLAQVVQLNQVCVALAARTAYLRDQRIVEFSRDAGRTLQLEPEGVWPLRKWRLVATAPGRIAPLPLALFSDRDRAERLATILGDWMTRPSD